MQSLAEISRYISLVKVKTTKASIQIHRQPAKLEITRERGGLEIKSNPIKLEIDNQAFFDSLGLKSNTTLARDRVELGKKAVSDSIARYNRAAKIYSQPRNTKAASQVAAMRVSKNIETMLSFIPESGPEFKWTGGTVDIRNTPDRLNIMWHMGGIERTYIPYSIEYQVEKGAQLSYGNND